MWKPVLSEIRSLSSNGAVGVDSRLGAVYVAYLDQDCRLLSVYPIRLLSGEDPEAVVVRDRVSQPSWPKCNWVLVGLAAELLFVSVTGRGLDTSPEDADSTLAYQARVTLAAGIGKLPGFAEAYAAVAAWGDFIQPWYGVWRLNERGRVVLADPCYQETLDIPMSVGVGV